MAEPFVETSEEKPWGHTIKNLLELYGMKPEQIVEFTCFHCAMFNNCEFAFDQYNTNGDCLYDH